MGEQTRQGRVWLGEEPAAWRAANPRVPLVTGTWEVGDRRYEDGPGWDSIDAAIEWGERSDEVYVRIGRSNRQIYFSAGSINGSLASDHFPDWPPSYEDTIAIEQKPDGPASPEEAAAIATKRVAQLRDEPPVIALKDDPD